MNTFLNIPALDVILSSMSEKAEKLAVNWFGDPCWDLEGDATEDEFSTEDCRLLVEFEVAAKAHWNDAANKRTADKAAAWGVDKDMAEFLMACERKIDQSTRSAASTLEHYFVAAGVPLTADMTGEVTNIVRDIVEAAAAKACIEILPKIQPHR